MPTATSGSTCGRKKIIRYVVMPRTPPCSSAVMNNPNAHGMTAKNRISTIACHTAGPSVGSVNTST